MSTKDKPVVVLKNLSKDYNIDPHKLRKILRDKFKTPKGRRWAYEEKSSELKKIREYLGSYRKQTSLPPAPAPEKSQKTIPTSAAKRSKAKSTNSKTRGLK